MPLDLRELLARLAVLAMLGIVGALVVTLSRRRS